MKALDDLTLLQWFVTGRSTLTANHNLRLETAFDAVQLLARRDGLLARDQWTGSERTIHVRRDTPYWELLNQLLAEHGWLATGSPLAGLVVFALYPLPSGYALHYTPASVLWKEWRQRQSVRGAVPQSLMVFVNTSWVPVCDLVCSQGQVYVKTLSGELVWALEERLVWLQQHDPIAALEDTTVFFAAPLPMPSGQPQLPVVRPAAPLPDRLPVALLPLTLPTVDTLLQCRQGQLYLSTLLGDVALYGYQVHGTLTSPSDTAVPVAVPLRVYCTAVQEPFSSCPGGTWRCRGCSMLKASSVHATLLPVMPVVMMGSRE